MAKKTDYVPGPDGDFDTWQNNFVNYVQANATALGITPAEVTKLIGTRIGWNTNFANSVTAKNAARGAVESKDDSRDTHESEIRQLTQKVQARPETTDAQREALGITVPDTTKTPLSENIVLMEPPPVIKPICTAPKQVVIKWYPDQTVTDSEAKPQGLDGVAIWYAEGGIPSDDAEWRFLALDTNTPYVHNVGNTGSVTIAYKAQWFDRRKRMGPFCDPVTIAVTS